MSETCRVLYQTNLRNSAFRWLSLKEYFHPHVSCTVLLKVAVAYEGRGVLQKGHLFHEQHCAIYCLYCCGQWVFTGLYYFQLHFGKLHT